MNLFKNCDGKIAINLSLKDGAMHPKVIIGDLDISDRVKGIKIIGGAGIIPSIELKLIPEEVDITMDEVPILQEKNIKDFSLEEITKEVAIRMCEQLVKNSNKMRW